MNNFTSIFIVAITFTLAACSYNPQPNYNIVSPIQTANDYLLNSRHFDNTVNYSELTTYAKKPWDFTFKKHQSLLINGDEWQQLLVSVAKFEPGRNKLEFENNLARTCWAINSDADIIIQHGAYRGVDSVNQLAACVSKRYGQDYPLFVYSWVDDKKVEDYFDIVAPKLTPESHSYRCKLIQEGYDFISKPHCVGVQ